MISLQELIFPAGFSFLSCADVVVMNFLSFFLCGTFFCASVIGCSCDVKASDSLDAQHLNYPEISALTISNGADRDNAQEAYDNFLKGEEFVKSFLQKNPGYSDDLFKVSSLSKEYTNAKRQGDIKIRDKKKAEYIKARDAFVKKYSKEKLLDMTKVLVSEVYFWNISHSQNGKDKLHFMVELANLHLSAMSELVSTDVHASYYFYFSNLLASQGNLLVANAMLSVAEDLALSIGDPEFYNFMGFNMTRGMNDYFLGNLSAAISLLENAPENTDEEHDWYLYNHLNLFLMYYEENREKGREYLKNFLKNEFSEKNKSSWAYQILLALDSSRPGDIIARASEFAKNEKERAEYLCEAYYYVGMKYYLDGSRDVARLFWVLTREQKVRYFLEDSFATQALRKFFEDNL